MNSSGQFSRTVGLVAALIALSAYAWWWIFNEISPNPITITIGITLVGLVCIHIVQLSLGKRRRPSATLTIIATGLWVFLSSSVVGLMFAATLIRGDQPVSSTFTVQMLYIAAGMALYAMALLTVRYRWILRPLAAIFGSNITFQKAPEPDCYPTVSPFSDGYFVHSHRLALTKKLTRIQEANGSDLAGEANIILAMTNGRDSLKADHKALSVLVAKLECASKTLKKRTPPSAAQHAKPASADSRRALRSRPSRLQEPARCT